MDRLIATQLSSSSSYNGAFTQDAVNISLISLLCSVSQKEYYSWCSYCGKLSERSSCLLWYGLTGTFLPTCIQEESSPHWLFLSDLSWQNALKKEKKNKCNEVRVQLAAQFDGILHKFKEDQSTGIDEWCYSCHDVTSGRRAYKSCICYYRKFAYLSEWVSYF